MPTLHYFPIRGRGEPIRYLLHDNGIAFEDNLVTDWASMKPTVIESGQNLFGQLPAFEDDGLYLVQSNAILRHLARKHNLYGADATENAKVDMYLDGAEDWRMLYLRLIYVDGLSDEAKATFAANAKAPIGTRGGGFVQAFESIIKRNGGDYLLGANITVADYSLFDLVDVVLRIVPDLLDDAPTLKAWHQRILARPGIAAYIAANAPHRAHVNGNNLG